MRPSILMSSWAFSSPLKRSVGPNTDMRSLDALLISLPWGLPAPDAKRGIDCAWRYAGTVSHFAGAGFRPAHLTICKVPGRHSGIIGAGMPARHRLGRFRARCAIRRVRAGRHAWGGLERVSCPHPRTREHDFPYPNAAGCDLRRSPADDGLPGVSWVSYGAVHSREGVPCRKIATSR